MTDHAKLLKRWNAGDHTVNASGAANMMPRSAIPRSSVTDLVDGFIADGWVRPEDRENEIAFILTGQLVNVERSLQRYRQRSEAESYRRDWVKRWLAE